MSHRWLYVIAPVVIGAVIWSRCDSSSTVGDGERPAVRDPAASGDHVASPATHTPAAPAIASRGGLDHASAFDAAVHHTADPCTAIVEPVVPDGYETLTADGITIAWSPIESAPPGPYDVPLKPVVLAHLVSGLLEEAATLSGTDRRERLTVIVDSSREEFFTRTHAPTWSAGVYDGGAVRLYAKQSEDLGVVIAALRHEVMHAQLHAGIGCMPVWFNEGLATYFGGPPPVRELLSMLRSADTFDLTSLQAPALDEMKDDRVHRVYALSLAMIVYIVEHGGDPGLRAAVQAVQSSQRQGQRVALELWDRAYPGVGYRAVLDALARKMFELPLGPDLDTILRGPVCCYGLKSVAELGCRAGVSPRPGATTWTDQSASPRATCSTKW